MSGGFEIDERAGEIISMDWDFIMEYYPDYYHADEIGWEDDLYCAITGECDDEKLARIKNQWGETMEELEKAHEELLRNIQQRAYLNYRQSLLKNN